jgi:predicted acetyltransferase
MADQHAIRPITDDEYAGFRRVHDHAFNTGPATAASWPRIVRQFEAERSLAAFDGSEGSEGSEGPDGSYGSGREIVGTAGVYSFLMAVPGAVLPVAGVTAVSVLPTHRRRGILRSLMHRQLADIAARAQEPIAALWASETPLYGRYGYGRASSHAHFRFGRGEGALSASAPVDPTLTLRLAEPGEVAGDLAKVYATVAARQPGFFERDDDWWERVLEDPEEERRDASPLRCLLAADGDGGVGGGGVGGGGVRGYALYRTFARWEEGTVLPDSALIIWELVHTDQAAGAALWRDLLSRDLVTEVTADLRPADDPLLNQLHDSRRARPRLSDNLWVRIIDLPAALSRRAYAGPVDVVLEVTDGLLPANAGRWRLRATGDGGGAVSCVRTDDQADIALDVGELGAAYLGGTRLGALAAAGLVSEVRPGTLGRLSAAMTWDPAPWCPRIF